MSSQRGNVQRNRPQKYQNTFAFKNNMHDTSKKTTSLNRLEMDGLCARCKAIIEWKIRYKKYKPLTKPRTCVRCGQRGVKRAYFTACESCISTLNVCGKCGMEVNAVPLLPALEQEALHQTESRKGESETSGNELRSPSEDGDNSDDGSQL